MQGVDPFFLFWGGGCVGGGRTPGEGEMAWLPAPIPEC